MRSIEYKPIFEATRGDLVESIHYGAFAVVNNQGELLASLGRSGIDHIFAFFCQTFPGNPIHGKQGR